MNKKEITLQDLEMKVLRNEMKDKKQVKIVGQSYRQTRTAPPMSCDAEPSK